MTGEIRIMGIVNLTPDSFFAGSRHQGADAVAQAAQMLSDGADVIDFGACSTRPGSAQPSLEEEWSRLSPVLQAISCGEMAGYALPGTCAPPHTGRGRGPLRSNGRGRSERSERSSSGTLHPLQEGFGQGDVFGSGDFEIVALTGGEGERYAV